MQRKSDSRLAQLRADLAEELGLTPEEGGPALFAATVAGTSGNDVILELGPRVQGVCPLDEFEEPPTSGDTLRLALVGREDGLWTFSLKQGRALASWDEMEVGSLVKGRVIGINKGGLELKVSGHNAFLPASQVAIGHVEDLESLAGETLVCEVVEIDPSRKRLVVSRRAVLEAEAQASRHALVDALAEGAVIRGKVTRIEPFGAFVDIGGVEGLLHVSNISHQRVAHPEEVLTKGQELEVQVLKIEEGGRRIGLGRKQLEADPWDLAVERLREDEVVEGTVRRLMDFGAFVEILPGVDGLLHVSQLGEGRVRSAASVLKVGETLSVRIQSIDPVQRRISLSRLDPRGAVLGSEEAAAGEEIDAVLESGSSGLGTNLGALLKGLRKDDAKD